jgi:antitoxin (DNA-binding transcriptional repressor) of toxin-antitoxin stability system
MKDPAKSPAQAVSIRDLLHDFSRYLKEVKKGRKIRILERNAPVAEIIPLNENLEKPGWKRKIKRISLKGAPLSHTLIAMREEDR